MNAIVSSLATIDPVAFEIPGLSRPVFWYGILFAAGFLAATLHWSLVMRKRGYPLSYGSDLGFWIIIGGVVGARLAFVLANPAEYLDNPLLVFRVDRGGLMYYGGFVGGILAVILFARRRKLPLPEVSDVAASGLPLGHALGRFGCFLNGCCFGGETTCGWAATFHDHLPRHPTQLYEAGFNLLVYGLLLFALSRRWRPGRVFALYLLVYPPFRFAIQFLRDDAYPVSFIAPFDQAQLLSMGLFAIGLFLWFRARPATDA